jgi:hypothetical protein
MRKMLQLMDTTCPFISQTTLAQTTASRRTLRVTVAAAALLSFGLASATLAQTPNSSSSGQTGTPSSSQTAKPPVAAPGTVAVTAATAAALAPYSGPKYDNRWEIYGGLLFMNDQAGQSQPGRRFNMGGAEVMATYWLSDGKSGPWSRFGLAADVRFGAGTTPVLSNHFNRVVVMETPFMGGVQYRGPKNRYAAVDFHVLGGGAYGDFSYAVTHYPGNSYVTACAADEQVGDTGNLGLYCNHIAPYGTVGGSIDFNESARLAIRLQPDMIFERFGTETREFFAISGGVVYRMGKRKQ